MVDLSNTKTVRPLRADPIASEDIYIYLRVSFFSLFNPFPHVVRVWKKAQIDAHTLKQMS